MQEAILSLLEDDPHITRKAIASQLGITIDGVRYHIDKMKEAGLIVYVGTSRNGYWKILNS